MGLSTPRSRTRGRRRRTRLLGGVVGAAVVVGGLAACEPVLSLEVDTAADGVDVAPGDGVCATAQGTCTLRAAISEANATPGFHRITIQAGIDPVLSLAGASDDANATGDLDVTGNIEILGQGATIDGAGLDRVFDVVAGHLRLHDVTVTGGFVPASGSGGGIRSATRLDLHRSSVVGNAGGAIHSSGPALSVTDSTIRDNAPASRTGALVVLHGDATVVRSLIDDSRLGIFAQSWDAGHITVLDSTVRTGDAGLLFRTQTTGTVLRSTLQTSGSGHLINALPGSNVRLAGSVLDVPRSNTRACYDGVTSEGYNVIPDGSCWVADPSDVVNANALLEPLADNGGPTQTMRPHANSPAVGLVPAGSPLCSDWIPTDQRGAPRPAAGNCNAGAVEAVGAPATSAHLVVDTAADGVDADPGDGACATAGGACSLRAAVMEANATNSHLPKLTDTITIAPGVDPVLTIAGADEDLGATGDLDSTGSLTIHGNGATVDGSGLDRVLDHDAPSLTLTDLTVTGGSVTGDGGAVRSLTGSVDVTDVTIHDNHASGSGGGMDIEHLVGLRLQVLDNTAGTGGGGLIATTVDLTASTLAGNQAGTAGGGAATRRSATFTRSTIHGNTAAIGGGVSEASSSTGIWLRFESSTISGNHAGEASGANATGLYSPGVRLDGSTVVGNTGAPAVLTTATACTWGGCTSWETTVATGSILVGTVADPACVDPLGATSSTNLAPDGSCGASLPGTGDLGPLADNGGPTLTHLPLAGSGAIDAIAPGTPALCDGTIATDQRGVIRPTGTGCDLGAVEQ